ncbi:MAG TPA: HPF/RaiA family ribosome-associated protein [Thermoanaerobaculia bacterium]|nr:HPF/RaiA family ribosome-associated protein [Thermoanaerobaculia bacterium]
MEIPLNITTRDVDLTPDLEDLVRRKASKLERFYNGIVGCRITLEGPGNHHNTGGPYNVRLYITVPSGEIVVSHKEQETLRAAIQASFQAAERQAEDLSQLQRGEVKTPVTPPEGPVVGLFPNEGEGYGFIAAQDGRQIYFHRNAVLPPGFDELSVGDRVRFAEEQGHEGPQASTVERLKG